MATRRMRQADAKYRADVRDGQADAKEKRRKRAPADAHNAWRAMDDGQRGAFLLWIVDGYTTEMPFLAKDGAKVLRTEVTSW